MILSIFKDERRDKRPQYAIHAVVLYGVDSLRRVIHKVVLLTNLLTEKAF